MTMTLTYSFSNVWLCLVTHANWSVLSVEWLTFEDAVQYVPNMCLYDICFFILMNGLPIILRGLFMRMSHLPSCMWVLCGVSFFHVLERLNEWAHFQEVKATHVSDFFCLLEGAQIMKYNQSFVSKRKWSSNRNFNMIEPYTSCLHVEEMISKHKYIL